MSATRDRSSSNGRARIFTSFTFGIGVIQIGIAVAGAIFDYPLALVASVAAIGIVAITGHFSWPFLTRLCARDTNAIDLRQLLSASDKLDDVCRSIEAQLADCVVTDSTTGAEVAAFLLDKWPSTLCPLWRQFTNSRDITVCIRKLHPRDKNKLMTMKVFPDSVVRSGVQPDPLEISDTICGRAYKNKRVIIVPSLEDDPDFDKIQVMWPDILDHVQSVVAAPVWVRKAAGKSRGSTRRDYVAAILQVDSPSKNTFHDNLATHLLMKMCAHKLGMILQLGSFIDQLTEVQSSNGKLKELTSGALKPLLAIEDASVEFADSSDDYDGKKDNPNPRE